MPARLIRDGLLDSESVLSLPVEARWLYVTILLSADDVGLFEATPFRLARKADVRRELADKLVEMLVDVDLVRLYEADGKRFGFIPRFCQRLQIKRARCPLPPKSLLQGDDDAINKINNLASNPTVDHRGSPLDNRNPPPEPEPEPKKKYRKTTSSSSSGPTPVAKIVELYHHVMVGLPTVRVMGKRREASIRSWWTWIMTSKKPSGERRAETVEAGLAWVKSYFERATKNDFIMGRGGPRGSGHDGWVASIDFLVSEKGMRQVIEKTVAA